MRAILHRLTRLSREDIDVRYCLIKQQTILLKAPAAKLEFSTTGLKSLLAIEINGLVSIIKFGTSGELLSITIASPGTEVDTGK